MKTLLFSRIPELSQKELIFHKTLFDNLSKDYIVLFWSETRYPSLSNYNISYQPEFRIKNVFKNFFFLSPQLNLAWLIRLYKWKRFNSIFELFVHHFSIIELTRVVYKEYQPDIFFGWNNGCYQFGLPADCLEKKGVKINTIEFGLLPKSLFIKKSRYLFSSIQIRQEFNVSNGEFIYDNFNPNYLLYNESPNHSRSIEKIMFLKGKKRILYLANGEIDMKICPNWHSDRKLFMPFFRSGVFLSKYFSNKFEDSILVIKPHPKQPLTLETQLSKNIFVSNDDPNRLIEWADLVIATGTKLERNVILAKKPLALIGSGMLFGLKGVLNIMNNEELRRLSWNDILNYDAKSAFENYNNWFNNMRNQNLLFFEDVISKNVKKVKGIIEEK